MTGQALAVIRADAGVALGSGHVRRSLAFAEPLQQRGYRVDLAVNAEAQAAVPELERLRGIDVLSMSNTETDGSAKEVAALKRRWPQGADLLIVDHYGRGAAFERAARGFARLILAIDDLADRRHDVDALLDSAPDRRPDDYAALLDRPAVLLLGPRYAPLAAAFSAMRPAALARRQAEPDVRRVTVSFGGTDPLGLTVQALRALAQTGFEGEVEAVFGLPGMSEREARVLTADVPFALEITVSATDMATRFARADLAIGAAGSSSFERCCLGLPAVVAVIADNQAGIARGLVEAGAALSLGTIKAAIEEPLAQALRELFANPARLTEMSRRAAALVDGRGAERAVDETLVVPQRTTAH